MSSVQSFRSFAMKAAPLSSTIHGGGKRRSVMAWASSILIVQENTARLLIQHPHSLPDRQPDPQSGRMQKMRTRACPGHSSTVIAASSAPNCFHKRAEFTGLRRHNARRCGLFSRLILRPLLWSRQLGDVGGHAPRFVAGPRPYWPGSLRRWA